MTLQNYHVIVIGENDNEFPSIKNRVATEFQAGTVTFAHAPIGSNIYVTINQLHAALVNSISDSVIVAMASALDMADVENVVTKFEQEHNISQKPLLRKGFNSANFEWRNQYDLGSAIVVAKRVEWFDAIKAQMTPHTDGETR